MLVSEPLKLNSAIDGLALRQVRIFGVPSPPKRVVVNQQTTADFSYRSDTKVLTLPSLSLLMSDAFEIQWL
ncbi:LYAG glucosidase, partial [Polypterus senegalus]